MQDDLVFIFKLIQVVRVNGNIFFLLELFGRQVWGDSIL